MSPVERILVTGGAGFIGSHLVDALVAAGHDVLVVDDFSVGSRDNVAHHHTGVRVEVADVRDRDALTRLMRGIDVVYHLATQCVRLSLSDPDLVHHVNTDGTLNVLLAARAHGVRRVINVSSSEAFGTARRVPMAEDHPFEPTTIYGASKLAAEHYARVFASAHGVDVTTVRPFNTYGARSHFEGAYGEVIPKFVVRVLNGLRPIVFGDGEQTRDFTYVSDTVRGIILTAESRALTGRSVNIARGREVSINEIALLVASACGRPDLTPEYAPARPADVRRHYADISLARRVLGFAPEIDIADGIRRYVDWFRASHPNPATLLSKDQAMNWDTTLLAKGSRE